MTWKQIVLLQIIISAITALIIIDPFKDDSWETDSFTIGEGQELRERFFAIAEKFKAQGDIPTAKMYYRRAAALGSSEAHFILGSQPRQSPCDKRYHLVKAAQMKHPEATKRLCDLAKYYRIINQHERALEIYEVAAIYGSPIAADRINGMAQYLKVEKNSEKAKKIYLLAAKYGSAQAHYNLTYYFNLEAEEKIKHLVAAAEKGHAEALKSAIGFYLGGGFKWTNPKAALELYEKALKANPKLSFYNQEEIYKTIKMCADAPAFDSEAFLKKYNIKLQGSQFEIWELAEEASRGGRFGTPNADLVFNLIIRDMSSPASFYSAVREFYPYWEKGAVVEFNIDDHVTGGLGTGFITARARKKEKAEQQALIDKVKMKLEPKTAALLDKTCGLALNFISTKARFEETHGGSGASTWMMNSMELQEKRTLDFFFGIIEGKYMPQPKQSFSDADKKLNASYKALMAMIDTMSKTHHVKEKEDYRKVQRLWLQFRDTAAELMVHIKPKTKQDFWKAWLTEVRTGHLRKATYEVKNYSREK